MSADFAGVEGYAPQIRISPGNPEAQKYGRLWTHAEYRTVAPGEQHAQLFLQVAKPRAGAHLIDFGCGTGRGALMLALVGGLRVTMIDFVNNCLDDDIRPMLETQSHTLGFLKRDLEVGPLPNAEYGYCTDVMEHIPPDKIDLVLNNILLAARHVFFSISTIDDHCGSLIGETLHLTVQPFAWWLERFNDRNCVVHWSADEHGVAMFYVSAWVTGETVSESGVLNVEESQARDNVRVNTAPVDGVQWKQVQPHLGRSDTEVMILAGGPSLADYETEIIAKRKLGIKAVTMNGSYGWALERGLAPVTQIVMDARPFNARFVQPIREDCVYLIASQCDPSVLKGLPPERTYLWHTMIELTRDILTESYPAGWYRVLGGSAVLLRAIPLLGMLGHRRFTLYGCDSCLSADHHHAYRQPENDGAPVIPVVATADGRVVAEREAEGRIFYCNPWMIAQAAQFVEMIRSPIGDDLELDIKGDGLLKHILTLASDAQERLEAAR
jgi:hypothetical protein